MKVGIQTGSLKGRAAGSARTSTGESTSAEKNSFLDLLTEVLPASTPERASLQNLWSQMPQAERDLVDNPSKENLGAYQDLVRAIARQTLDEAMKVEKRTRPATFSRAQNELTTVRIIDEKLHRMALVMLSPENSAFSMMKSLAEIRGFLMDMRR